MSGDGRPPLGIYNSLCHREKTPAEFQYQLLGHSSVAASSLSSVCHQGWAKFKKNWNLSVQFFPEMEHELKLKDLEQEFN